MISLRKEILCISRRNEGLSGFVESSACLDSLLDDGLFGAKCEAPASRALEVELSQGLAFFLDFGLILAKAIPENDMVDGVVETLLIAVYNSEARPLVSAVRLA